jgi:tetratricopeptide (TPR) repeat protein
MTQLRVRWFVALFGTFAFMGTSTFLLAEEKQRRMDTNDPFYSREFPKERMRFWESVSRSFVLLNIEELVEKLKEIDEFSDESGLSLMEFRNLVGIKCACMLAPVDESRKHRQKELLLEYLDRVADYTRKSPRWQKEVFVIEPLLFLYYANAQKFEKAYESISLFLNEAEKRTDEWDFFYSPWDTFTFLFHAACVYAALGKYSEAIEKCDAILNFKSFLLEDAEAANGFIAMLWHHDVSREHYQAFMSEVQKKRERFKEKKEWSYFCQISFMFPAAGAEKNNVFGMHVQWFHRREKWLTPPAPDHTVPYVIRMLFPLIPVAIDGVGLKNL